MKAQQQPTAKKPAKKPEKKPSNLVPGSCRSRELEMRERLQRAFPRVFFKRPGKWKALATGIKQEIARRLGITERRDLVVLGAALAAHCRCVSYELALVRGGSRFNLDGKPVGEITAAHRQAARDRLAAKRAALASKARRQAARARRMASAPRKRPPTPGQPGQKPATGPRVIIKRRRVVRQETA